MNIFRYVGNAIGGVNYTPTNSAIDVVVIEQPDGTLLGSPFHVNFGVRSVLHATDKKVFITVNGERTEIEMKLGKSGEGFFVKSFGAGEEPANPLSPVGTPPGSPRGGASLTRQGSTCSQKRRRFNRAKTTSAADLCDQSESSFDPSIALSDSEIEISQHRPAVESKSVPSMGYLSDPEIGGSADEPRDAKSQKVIVGWKWGELPETSLNESQSEPHISTNQSESFESNQSDRVESPLEESRLNVPEPVSEPVEPVQTSSKADKNQEIDQSEHRTEIETEQTENTDENSESRDEPDDLFDMFNREMEMSLCGGLHADIDRDEFDKYKVLGC